MITEHNQELQTEQQEQPRRYYLFGDLPEGYQKEEDEVGGVAD